MLETLTKNFSQIVGRLRARGRLSEENLQAAAADIRTALLDADVAPAVADEFIRGVMEDAVGRKIDAAMNPGKAFVGVVFQQLTTLMGDANAPLRLTRAPSVILACGLQGAGKTTNLAKIAKHLKIRLKKRVLLAGVDTRRPAAMEQLQTLARMAEVACYESDEMGDPLKRAEGALAQARRELADVLLIDTAGRIALDDALMDEIALMRDKLRPAETLFFIDAMQGRDAVNTARAFHERVDITGLVLTKFDGDARGGAALSAKMVTGQPIKFVGVGEKLDDLQPFYPERYASRILGMGDAAALADMVRDKVDVAAVGRVDKKIFGKPSSFNLNDQLEQFRQMKKMGGVSEILDKLPGQMAEKLSQAGDERQLKRQEAIILSMTPDERKFPELVKASRKRRIAAGAAAHVSQVNQLLKQHEMMKKI